MQSPRNERFILLKHRQGLSVGQIYTRCHERFVWDGQLPTMQEIERIIRGAGGHVGATGAGRVQASGPNREQGR